MRPSDARLHDALEEAGLHTLASRAATGEWNDFFGKHELPQHALIAELVIAQRDCPPSDARKLEAIIERAKRGDFDGTAEEADEWAATSEGQAAFGKLIAGAPLERTLLERASDHQDRVNLKAVGQPAEVLERDGDPGYLVGEGIDETIAKLCDGTGIDPQELFNFAEHSLRNLTQAVKDSGAPPSVVVHGGLLNAVLIGYHARRLEELGELERRTAADGYVIELAGELAREFHEWTPCSIPGRDVTHFRVALHDEDRTASVELRVDDLEDEPTDDRTATPAQEAS